MEGLRAPIPGVDSALVAKSVEHLLGLAPAPRPAESRSTSCEADVELFGITSIEIREETLGDLVLLARKGEAAAFGELYRRLAPMVAATAQRTIHDPDAVADVVQETFVRALERLDQLREPSSVAAWLSGIARRVATDALRAHYRAATGLDEATLDLTEGGAGPDSFAEQRMRLREVDLAMALLSRSDAQMLILVANLGLSTEELAHALGIAPTAAKVRLHRARRRLNHLLDRPTESTP